MAWAGAASPSKRAPRATPLPRQALRRFERFTDLPPASYRLSAKPVLPPRGVEGAANGAAAAAEDLPIEAPLRRKLEAFLAPFNRELAARTGIQF